MKLPAIQIFSVPERAQARPTRRAEQTLSEFSIGFFQFSVLYTDWFWTSHALVSAMTT